MTVANEDKDSMRNLNNLATRDAHHYNMRVIFVCQNLNFGNGKLHTTRCNSQYLLLCKNLMDSRNIKMVGSNKKYR